jgi:hypothetical protein
MPATKDVPETPAVGLVCGDWSDGLPVLPGNLSHLLCSLTPGIAVVQPTQPRNLLYGRIGSRPLLYGTSKAQPHTYSPEGLNDN